jgi:hypothetical protein
MFNIIILNITSNWNYLLTPSLRAKGSVILGKKNIFFKYYPKH